MALARALVRGSIPRDESVGGCLATLVALATDRQTNRHSAHLSNA